MQQRQLQVLEINRQVLHCRGLTNFLLKRIGRVLHRIVQSTRFVLDHLQRFASLFGRKTLCSVALDDVVTCFL